jgi:hypothetical protein
MQLGQSVAANDRGAGFESSSLANMQRPLAKGGWQPKLRQFRIAMNTSVIIKNQPSAIWKTYR